MSNNRNRKYSRSLSNNALASTIIFSNADLTVDDAGWTVIPYGLWKHSMGWQKFGKEEALAICNAFTSWMGRIRRAVTGLPVFKGHPDQPEFAAEFPDKTEYGQVAEMQARDDGLAIKQVLSNAGADLVRGGLKFISPRWDAHPVGEKDDATVWAPYRMLSIGLVKRPNIPNASLINHAPDFMKKEDLIALFKLSTTATDAEIQAAVAVAAARPTADSLSNAESRLTTSEGRVAALTTEVGAVKATVTTLTSERDNANVALANERKSHRTSLVNAAIKDGRVKPADQVLWNGRLETNFEAESKTLANLTPSIKTAAVTGDYVNLAEVNAILSKMTEEQRIEFSKTGVLVNDDGAMGDNDMANVGKLCNLVRKEMNSGSYDHIKDPNAKYSAAMNNVLKIHKKFLQPKHEEAQ